MSETTAQSEGKRFNPNPESMGMMKKMRDILPSLQEQFPYVSGIGFYGSRTKGTENPNSDMDLRLFFNRDRLNDYWAEAYGFREVRNALLRSVDFRMDRHDWSVDISEEATQEDFKSFVEHVDYENENDFPQEQKAKRLIESPSTQRLFARFFLAAGDEIYHNRQYVLDRFKELPNGDSYFQNLMQCMGAFEADTRKDAKPRVNYPKTIAEGEKYFLKSSVAINTAMTSSSGRG